MVQGKGLACRQTTAQSSDERSYCAVVLFNRFSSFKSCADAQWVEIVVNPLLNTHSGGTVCLFSYQARNRIITSSFPVVCGSLPVFELIWATSGV